MKAEITYHIHPVGQQVLQILLETANFHHSTYCYPSQENILGSLYIRFGRIMSRRTLCRWTAYLEKAGFIHKQKRHRRAANGQLELHSTLYTFTLHCMDFWRSVGRKIGQLIGFTAVTVTAQSTHKELVSQPETSAKSARSTPARTKTGLRRLKEILNT